MKTFTTLLLSLSFSLLSTAQTKVPSATVQALDGKKVDSRTFSNKGKPIIINFTWATRCAPCKRELSVMEKYEKWQQETGVKLIAISIDDARSMARVAPYVNGQDWDYEVYLDPNGDLKRALNVNNVPHTFLVNGAGDVYQHNNYEPMRREQAVQEGARTGREEVTSLHMRSSFGAPCALAPLQGAPKG